MTSPQVELVALDDHHVATTFEWLEDDELRRQIDSIGTPTREQHQSYWRERRDDSNRMSFAILHQSRHVGNCGLIVDRPRRKAEMWAYLATQRGSGVGRVAVRRMLDIAFDEVQLERVFVRTLASNPAALRFWRSVGFVDEGVLRADSRHDGSPVDAHVLSLLRKEWQGVREA